jgi:cytochrome c553
MSWLAQADQAASQSRVEARMGAKGTLLAVLMLSGWSTQSGAADSMALGRHLAQECTSCHRADGADNGIPSLPGHDADYLVRTLSMYKSGERKNPAMVSVAQSLDDEQIRALALYWASIPEPARGKSSAPAKP